MKKLICLIVFAFCIFGFGVQAEQWYTANQITVKWNQVEPIKPDDTITYIIYVKNVKTEEVTVVEETGSLSSVVTFSEEGDYYLGVSTKRVTIGGEILESEVNWSNVNGAYTPNPFGVKFYVKPDIPLNLITE